MTNTKQDFTFEDPTKLMTTTPTYQSTETITMSSSTRGAAFYFQCAIVVMGFVGTAANGLILYALIASKQHKKHPLIVNQNVLDLVSCFFLCTTYAAKASDIYLSGVRGYWLCLTLLSEGTGWGPFLGSLINLAAITIERYLKVVHHVWVKKNLRKWMIYSTVAFSWISGIAIAIGVTISMTDVVNGVCYTMVFWKSHTAQMAYGIWYFLSFFVIILLIFVFFYWRILIAIRRQASVMAAHGATGSGTAQTQSKQIQTNVIKTMMLVSALFAVTWAPVQIYYLILNIHSTLTLCEYVYYVTMFAGYVYNCTNPFIYAINFDPVRHILLGLNPCKKTTEHTESIEVT